MNNWSSNCGPCKIDLRSDRKLGRPAGAAVPSLRLKQGPMWHTISTRDNWSSNCGPCKIDFDSDWQDLVELVTDQANLRVASAIIIELVLKKRNNTPCMLSMKKAVDARKQVIT